MHMGHLLHPVLTELAGTSSKINTSRIWTQKVRTPETVVTHSTITAVSSVRGLGLSACFFWVIYSQPVYQHFFPGQYFTWPVHLTFLLGISYVWMAFEDWGPCHSNKTYRFWNSHIFLKMPIFLEVGHAAASLKLPIMHNVGFLWCAHKPQHPYLMQRDPPFVPLEFYFILLLPRVEQFWFYFFNSTQALISPTQLHFTGPYWLWVRPCSVFGILCYLSGTRLAQDSWLGQSYNEGEGTKCLCERQAAKDVSTITCCTGCCREGGGF